METHADHLHNAPGKKIWHYLFEFLMLFLAVFCGFLAENFREHKVEKERELVFIKSLYQDLKDDAGKFSEYDHTSMEYFNAIDSVMILMKSPERDQHINKIYYLARAATMKSNSFISLNNRTFEQMKSSGSLRLISDQQVADSVSEYYYSLKNLEFQNDVIRDRIAQYMQCIGRVFDGEVMYQIFQSKQEPTQANLKFITNDAIAINEMLMSAQYYYGARMLQKKQCLLRAERGQRLLKVINSKYHLE